MKVILVGYPGSQPLVPATSYLIKKYMPGFDVRFLNYTGKTAAWSNFVADYLSSLGDQKVIFALDDYLIRKPIDMARFEEAAKMKPCVKLCACTEIEHKEYPVTTQYTIWNRLELITLLRNTTTPWDFEINGSKLFRGTSVVHTCLDYDTSSALSARWPGVHLDGLAQEDVDAITGLLV
jgi:hypothetical protein